MLWLTLLACQTPYTDDPSAQGGGVEIGAEAPDVELIGPDGEAFALSEDKGQVILLKLSGFY